MLDNRIGDAAKTVLRPERFTVTRRCREDNCCALAATASANSAMAGELSSLRSGTAMSAAHNATRPYAVRL